MKQNNEKKDNKIKNGEQIPIDFDSKNEVLPETESSNLVIDEIEEIANKYNIFGDDIKNISQNEGLFYYNGEPIQVWFDKKKKEVRKEKLDEWQKEQNSKSINDGVDKYWDK